MTTSGVRKDNAKKSKKERTMRKAMENKWGSK
jgi:hypothetical protein